MPERQQEKRPLPACPAGAEDRWPAQAGAGILRSRDTRSRGTVVLVLLLVVALGGCARIRPPRGVQPVGRVMMTTGYCKCGQCCGWKRTWYGRPVFKSGALRGKRKKVGITATGARAGHGTIAADTSRYPFGSIMYIEGYGYGRVEDRGGAIKGEHIDLFFGSHQRALEWGRQRKKVKVWVVR